MTTEEDSLSQLFFTEKPIRLMPTGVQYCSVPGFGLVKAWGTLSSSLGHSDTVQEMLPFPGLAARRVPSSEAGCRVSSSQPRELQF